MAVGQVSARKRKHSKRSQNEEMTFEKKPRYSKDHNTKTKNIIRSRNLLPIKESSGRIITQSIEIEDKNKLQENPEEALVEKKVEHVFSKHKLVINRKKHIEKSKVKIARIVEEVTTDPQNNLKLVKELRLMLEDRSCPESCATVWKFVTASLSCVFVDIIPGYRIRERTEQEKEVKLSKDVKNLTEYEEGLLHQYKLFLQMLEKMIESRGHPGKNHVLSSEAQQSLGKIAIHSLCDLYAKTSHFNFHNNIAVVLVPVANDDPDPDVRKMCCDTMCTLFASDKSGSATLASVNMISKVAKERGTKKLQPEFLKTLLSLRINKVDYSMVGHRKVKEDKKKAKELKKKASKRVGKKLKKEMDIENELKEAAATEDLQERTKFHTETIQQVFLTYFRILKHQTKDSAEFRALLPIVLEGLAKFAHLINVDFFGDLLRHIQSLVTSGGLTLREKLHCIFTVFQILSGQGEVLNTDPVKFYSIMFGLIHELPADMNRKTASSKSDDNLNVLLENVDMMLNKRRKQITLSTLTAFIKRLTTMSLQLQPYRYSVAVLDTVHTLLNSHSKTISLFDTESQAIGRYDPNVDDPDRCGSSSAVLWEFHTLRRHFVPLVSQSANRMLKEKSV